MEQVKSIHRKQILPVLLVLIAVASLGSFAIGTDVGRTTTVSSASDGGVFHNLVSVEVKHPSCTVDPNNTLCGQPGKTAYAWNTVTALGKNNTRDILGGFAPYNDTTTVAGMRFNWTVIQLSTDGGAPALTDLTCPTAVTGNGLDIAVAGTIVKQLTGNFTVSKTFSVTGTQAGIQKVCIHNSTLTGGPLMASALISSTNVQSGDTLTVNYSVAVT
jgi:hypothetical protein